MTQYQRITGKVFGGNATATGNDPQIAQFGSALANTFVGTTDPETIQSLPAWGQGWIGAVTPETQFPPLPEMTGVMKVLSHQICSILQQGVPTWDSGTIYYTGNFASLNGKLYISQTDENQGNNPATDTTNWKEFSSGGGGQFTGQTIFSFDPLIEDTLHLADGALLLVGGMYDQFINDYIANLYTNYPQRFCTEEEWQTSVSTYGVCGKYVYNEGVSVRLPRVTGIVEGTLDVSALGSVVEAGLPNIEGSINGQGQSLAVGGTGCLNVITTSNRATDPEYGRSYYYRQLSLDASRSSEIYGNSNTVQPQTVQGYLYIVVGTGSKTLIEVDIDNIATDLNGKADTDLSNITEQAKATIGGYAMPSDNYIDLTLGANGTNYTAPANGYYYLAKGTSSNQTLGLIRINIGSNYYEDLSVMLNGPSNGNAVSALFLPVKKGDTVRVSYNATGATSAFKFIYAEGEI